MVDYKIVKHCLLCKKRYVLGKRDPVKYYCVDCQIRINKPRED